MPPGSSEDTDTDIEKAYTDTGKDTDPDTDTDTYIYMYVYIEHIYTYMLHKERYINYTENRGNRPPMKNTDLTGKYNVKVIFHEKHEMTPRSVRSFCL